MWKIRANNYIALTKRRHIRRIHIFYTKNGVTLTVDKPTKIEDPFPSSTLRRFIYHNPMN